MSNIEITLQEVINGKEIDLKSLKRRDIKWLIIELISMNIHFTIINNVLKRVEEGGTYESLE